MNTTPHRVPESHEVLHERAVRFVQQYYRYRMREAAILSEACTRATRSVKAFSAAMQGFNLPKDWDK